MNRFFSIELLRFLTSLSVLLYHYRHFFSPLNSLSENDYSNTSSSLPFFNQIDWLYTFGFYGVHVFYTISGFVFAHVYLSSNKQTTLKEFSVNRFARLYPLHLITLLLVAFMQFIFFTSYGSYQFELLNDFYHFFLQIFFISSWGFENGHSFNAPIWSVSVEIGIYIIFFMMLKLFQKYNLILTIILSLILIVIDKMEIIDNLFLECARLFFSGVLIFYLINRFNSKKLSFLLIALTLTYFSFVGNFKTFLFCPAIVLLCLSIEDYISNQKLRDFLGKLGNLTYALYLLHVPIQLILIFSFKKFFSNFDVFYTNYFFFFYFFILFSISHLIFNYYEKPLNQLIRKSLLNG